MYFRGTADRSLRTDERDSVGKTNPEGNLFGEVGCSDETRIVQRCMLIAGEISDSA